MTVSFSDSETDRKPPYSIRVWLATPVPIGNGVLDYLAEDDVPPRGQVVIVPLGSRQIPGVVLGPTDGQGQEMAPEDTKPKLRPILHWADLPPLSPAFLDWLGRVASWTMAHPGAVLRMALPVPKGLYDLPPQMGWVTACPPRDDISSARNRVLEAAFGLPAMTATDMAYFAGVSPSTIRTMAKAGLLLEAPMVSDNITPPDPERAGLSLNSEQKTAAETLGEATARGGYAPFVLDGITGSGKTEVYFDAIASVLKQDRQALILLPEIALSPATEDRFTRRFGARPVLWHSGLTETRRVDAFRRLTEGGPMVVVGARSALFLPFRDLGLIVVDEEHDPSYKQDEQVVYHARDMAVMRASFEQIPIILASATPSLETEVNIERGRYKRLTLSSRIGQADLPTLKLVDMRKTPPERQAWLAPPLVSAIAETLEKGQQTLLFLNRRGYAPVTLCRTCGERITCPNCATWLVDHRQSRDLRCHHCGHRMRQPDSCPSCGTADHLVACGPGVERLAEEVSHRFPEARQAILSSDHVKTPAALADFIRTVEDREVDIIIGTQMVAKGHHFPDLTLVGVVDADLGLAGGDLRAAEHTWQLLVQVAGRAGRSEHKGQALLQTHMPDTPVLQALMRRDRAMFLDAEKSARAAAGMPPYGRLAGLLLTSASEVDLKESAAELGRTRPVYEGVSILGPAPAPIARLRGRYRMRFLVKAERQVDIQAILREWLEPRHLPRSVRCQIDVDPYHFF
ncbi:primosomal protein N' [Alphaproteobacteria bacterium LSUCC0684]